jgi:DNA-binding Xre family transcriptional regulator
MNREHDGIADWVINELCDELECDGDEIVEKVRRLIHRADTYEKALQHARG